MPEWDEYRWASGVLNSRRIWWSGRGHLVPLLDFVNCRSDGLTRVHRTVADESGAAVTRAAKAFVAGEEVVEDYGQPNHIYFLHHGFLLDENPHDCVLLPRADNERRAPCVSHSVPLATAALRRRAQQHLDSYTSSIAYDIALLASLANNPLRRDIVRFRLSEKRLLTQLLNDADNDSAHDELWELTIKTVEFIVRQT